MPNRSNFDSAWKDALEAYFPQFLALLWPDIHEEIDWQYAPVFRDKELQALLRSRARGRLHVDKLVEVRSRDGSHQLILIHVEIQTHNSDGFARRMFDYYYRLSCKHVDRPVVSLAVITEDRLAGNTNVGIGSDAAGRYLTLIHDKYGCQFSFRLPVVYLESWRSQIDELQAIAPNNPFAVVVLAQLTANDSRHGRQRLVRKTELVRRLYHWKFSRDDVWKLFRILDAIIMLPESLESEFDDELCKIEEETQMTYVTSIERVRLKKERTLGIKEGEARGEARGFHEGKSNLLIALIARRFGSLPDWASVRIAEADEASLDTWAMQILDAERIEDVFA